MKFAEYMFMMLLGIIIIFVIIIFANMQPDQIKPTYKASTSGTCNAISCSTIDPVSDPKYNMQQIVKQSILLEEHLANKNKRCRDCITKHFLHIIGLAEEAQMLATNNIQKYPLINECVELYNKLFKNWLKNHDTDVENTCLNTCDELRMMRKRLIALYFFES
jgi:hypothetical protein